MFFSFYFECLGMTYKQAVISARALHSAKPIYINQYSNRDISVLDWDHILSHMVVVRGENVMLQETGAD